MRKIFKSFEKMKPLTEKAHYIVVAFFMLVGGAISLHSNDDPCLIRTVAVSVTTEAGEPVKGLVAPNFRAKFHGRPVDLVSATYDNDPRRIVIVLDASGSMFENWSLEISVAEGLLRSVPAQNSIALLTFANRVEDKVDFNQGREAVLDDLVRLEAKDWTLPKGQHRKTSLLNTLVAALDLLRPSPVGDAIYLISDGDDNASLTRLSDVRTLLLKSGVRLFALLSIDALARVRTKVEGIGFHDVQGLAEETGGDSLTFVPGENSANPTYLPRPIQLTERAREIMSFASRGFAREISDFYRVQIKLPQPADKTRDWKIEVVDTAGNKNPHLRIIYPHKLAPCP